MSDDDNQALQFNGAIILRSQVKWMRNYQPTMWMMITCEWILSTVHSMTELKSKSSSEQRNWNTLLVYRRMQWQREDPFIAIHVDSGDLSEARKEVLVVYQQLGAKLNRGISVVKLLLPEPWANWQRVPKIRAVNMWLLDWCGRKGFWFLAQWCLHWTKKELGSTGKRLIWTALGTASWQIVGNSWGCGEFW